MKDMKAKNVSKVIKSGTLPGGGAKPGGKSGVAQPKVGTQKAGGTATKAGNTGGKFAGAGLGKSGAKQMGIGKSVAGKVTVPGAKSGASTGKGGGKRGTGTMLDGD